MQPEKGEEIILVDKPKGITSFDVIRRLRKELNIKKMGHAGTLDPLATGLMIIGVGGGTKKLTEYIKLPKEYVAEVLIGEKRSTGDMEGEILEEANVSFLERTHVEAILKDMVGTLRLQVSAYSAIKKGGVPLYTRARKSAAKGETIPADELPLRDMVVTEAKLLNIDCLDRRVVLTIRFAVGSGTYIRSLGEELGRRLGYPATLRNLRRTQIGDFRIEDARTLKDI